MRKELDGIIQVPISFPEAAILLVSDGSRFFQRMTKGTPGDEVVEM